MVYRIALWEMGWLHPYALLSIVTDSLTVSVMSADILTAAITVYLLGGGVWASLKLRQIQAEKASFKTACPACGIRLRFAVQNLGQVITCPKCRAAVTLSKAEEILKISCYFCGGHIEFAPYSVGTKTKCPHCNMDITLKQAALI